ncbi:MAG: hypothetical protein J5626_02525 [Lachnospiraceae bacterium]|nr:hypothetical protein [Lachnospiraceae bacterium]
MKTLMTTLDVLEKGFRVIASAAATALDDTYDLIVVDDEATPLSAGPLTHNYYPAALVTVLILAAITILAVWLIRRNTYKARLLELRKQAGDENIRVPFRIKDIKDAVREAENNLL